MDISDKLHLLFQRVSDCLTSSQSVHPSLKKQNVYSICFICNTVYLWQYLSQFTHTIESRWKLHFKWKCQHIRSESDAALKWSFYQSDQILGMWRWGRGWDRTKGDWPVLTGVQGHMQWQRALRGECEGVSLQDLDLTQRRYKGLVGKVDRLTGTNLQYHLLGDLMADDDWTTPGESGTDVRTTVVTNFLLLQLRFKDKPLS